MKNKIETKVSDIVDYILKKPVDTITFDDYLVMTDQLNKIRPDENGDNSWYLIFMLVMLLTMASPVKRADG